MDVAKIFFVNLKTGCFSTKSLDSGTNFKRWAAFPFIVLTSAIAADSINSSAMVWGISCLTILFPMLIKSLVGVAWIVKCWTLDHLLSDRKNYLVCSQIAGLAVLNDSQAYLVACFHWPIPCFKRHTEVFLTVLQDKREPQITVIIRARFLFRLLFICLMQSELIFVQCVY